MVINVVECLYYTISVQNLLAADSWCDKVSGI